MADYIDKQIEIFSKIEELFEKNREDLKDIEKSLNKDITEILEEFSETYDLKSESGTAVNPINYYSIKSRVKSTHSLKEKLIRKDLGLKISNTLSLALDNFHKNHANVKESLFKIDDIIGVRIVTELKADCPKVYALIQDYNEHFIGRKIIFNLKELKNQPETMQNGLPIYRIKGTYKKEYGFELQIKSKIDEAWGEMDHSIFYKDYSVSPIKNTVQVTMNNVGELLDKIEDLLLGLRNSEKNYKEKKGEIDFLKELNDDVFDAIKDKLGDNYELGKIASSLKFIRAKTKVNKAQRKLEKIDYKFLNLKVKSALHKNYLEHRNNNFELLIMETLYLNWRTKANSGFKINASKYPSILEEYINLLAENIVESTKNLIDFTEGDIKREQVKNIFASFSGELKKKSLFIDVNSVISLKVIDNYITEMFNEYLEENEAYKEFEGLNNLLINIYSKKYLGFDEIAEIDKINNDFPLIGEQNQLPAIIYDINSKIQTRINKFMLEENQNELNTILFFKKLTDSVINEVRNK